MEFAVLAAASVVSASARQWIGACVLAALAVGGVALRRWVRRRQLSRVPDSLLEPVTIRFTDDGLHIERTDGYSTTRWSDIWSVRATAVAWYLFRAGGNVVPLYRRNLSDSDQDAIAVGLRRFLPSLRSAR